MNPEPTRTPTYSELVHRFANGTQSKAGETNIEQACFHARRGLDDFHRDVEIVRNATELKAKADTESKCRSENQTDQQAIQDHRTAHDDFVAKSHHKMRDLYEAT